MSDLHRVADWRCGGARCRSDDRPVRATGCQPLGRAAWQDPYLENWFETEAFRMTPQVWEGMPWWTSG